MNPIGIDLSALPFPSAFGFAFTATLSFFDGRAGFRPVRPNSDEFKSR